ncbi:MAG: isochorismate synthase [Actinomycetota bacterium]|nr:isochorismate synthase [Actinomycetota bacterium]
MTTLAEGRAQRMPLVVRTVAIEDPGALLSLLPSDAPLAWLRRGAGLVGWGEAARLDTGGEDRFAATERWWRDVSAVAVVRDEVGLPGCGLVAFGSFAFAAQPGSSLLVVPQVVVGHRSGSWWVTTVGSGTLTAPPTLGAVSAARAPRQVVFSDGARSGTMWESVVADAVRRIDAGELEKVVLARDLVARTDDPVDVRWPLQRLAESYPTCWTFHVGGLFGATPEMLVRRERGLVTSRVLAGTIRRSGDDARDLALAASLARSSKDLEEHEYAVRSVAEALAPHCTSMNVPETPFVLHLPNVMHLATDVTGVMQDNTTSLGLAAALHPSAAVGGTPTAEALGLIYEIEGMDRGRYAGPVGWIDTTGDGEWGIALRCGQIDGSSVRLFAGCGVVADSDPEAELAEAQAKFVPVRDALG